MAAVTWLGVRCWADRIALVVVDDDTEDGPVVAFARRQVCPRRLDPGQRAAWYARAVNEALDESRAGGVAVRVADSNPTQVRVESEGAALACAGHRGLAAVTLRRQSMMKPLEVDRQAGAWAAFQKTDAFIGSLVGDEKDAAMASLGAARR